ncbi:EamA family transporter [Bordetella genomosp. 1]|uniref:EamA family transporter n=1 Tax=Bordetella genomosp. 1 TaxID=1395607 RepID=A0A261SEM9_9BORD|nr:DMT family transporter [Bordetella genomosp. 1]MDQ8034498.1 DMT family transporter [Bordetella sp.]OZI35859.1 EamA family transporter [Bordetella genomosp. 1]OZI58526.1 EamA family transporter [Bordetella genomosp. 1]
MQRAQTGLAAPAGAASTAAPTHTLLGIGLLVLSMWTLSGLDASGKWVMAAGVPLMILCWVRYVVHLVLVLALVVPARGWGILRSRRPRDQIVRGGAMFCATLVFFTTLTYLPQAEATAINFLAPLIVLSVAPWVLKEPPRISRWIACGVAFVGVLIIIRPGGGLHPMGVLFGLLTACCFAAQFIATRRVATDNPYTSLIWSGAVGTLCLTLALPFTLPAALPVLRELSLGNWALLISTGLSGALGHLLQIGAYRNAAASTLAPFVYLQIVSATAVGWLFWDHFPDGLTWLGIGIIIASGVVIGVLEWQRGRRARLA